MSNFFMEVFTFLPVAMLSDIYGSWGWFRAVDNACRGEYCLFDVKGWTQIKYRQEDVFYESYNFPQKTDTDIFPKIVIFFIVSETLLVH